MKKLLLCLLLISSSVLGQVKSPVLHDSLFSTYYHQRVSHFKTLPQTENDIVFLGNSINDGGEWSEMFNDLKVKNRGISGDVTAGVLHRLDEVYKGKPAKVFLLIGTNDLARGVKVDSVIKNIFWFRSPATDSPMPETWDNHQIKVWVNGNLVDPPKWKQGGLKGNSEIPLIDEGYEYRQPSKILLKQSWNEVLIKAPIGSFKGKDWQNPEKWMFTFVPVDKL